MSRLDENVIPRPKVIGERSPMTVGKVLPSRRPLCTLICLSFPYRDVLVFCVLCCVGSLCVRRVSVCVYIVCEFRAVCVYIVCSLLLGFVSV